MKSATLPLGSKTFTFDPVLHRYAINGIPAPGITRILDLTGFITNKEWFTEESRQRGKDIHRACWFLAENDLNWDTVRPEYRARVRGFQKFLEDVQPKLILVEQPLCSFQFGFCGTPDFVFEVQDVLWCVDVKTGRSGLPAELQTAAQTILIKEMPSPMGMTMIEWLPRVIKRFALELPENGKYKLIPHRDDVMDTVMFLNANAMVHRRINCGELKL
jgi:hypothetical protein